MFWESIQNIECRNKNAWDGSGLNWLRTVSSDSIWYQR